MRGRENALAAAWYSEKEGKSSYVVLPAAELDS